MKGKTEPWAPKCSQCRRHASAHSQDLTCAACRAAAYVAGLHRPSTAHRDRPWTYVFGTLTGLAGGLVIALTVSTKISLANTVGLGLLAGEAIGCIVAAIDKSLLRN